MASQDPIGSIQSLQPNTLTSPSIHVGMRCHQRDSTAQFEYSLSADGRIFARCLDIINPKRMLAGDLLPDPNAINWHLFDGYGIPFGKNHKRLLPDGDRIVQISAASEIVVAVSNRNQVFIYKPTILERPVVWSAIIGQPFAANLYLPESCRYWTFSCSVGYPRNSDGTIKRNLNAMARSEQVDYFSDARGIRHDFGFTATVYVLLKDGRTIVFWDTGLPPSFSRGFLTPLHGTTQGQLISAAGSTIFLSVIDSNSRLRYFTVMKDYEIDGACLGLQHTYSDHEPLGTAIQQDGESIRLGFGIKKLPLASWREHHTTGIASQNLSPYVSIYLTGQGDNARELRIAGIDANGYFGFYYKNIAALNWQFHPTGIAYPIGRPIFTFNSLLPAILKNYTGQIKNFTHQEISISLIGFHHYLTADLPCYLRLTHGAISINLKLHIVDGWHMIRTEKYHENLIGTDEEPKLLRATLMLTPEQITIDQATPLGACMAKYFLPQHNQTNKLFLRAADSLVILDSENDSLKIKFSRRPTQQEVNNSFYMQMALNPRLNSIPTDEGHRAELYSLNAMTLDNIQTIHRQHLSNIIKFALLLPAGGIGLHHFVHPIFKLHVHGGDPRKKIAIGESMPLFKRQVKIATAIIRKQESISYQRATNLLQTRLYILSIPNSRSLRTYSPKGVLPMCMVT